MRHTNTPKPYRPRAAPRWCLLAVLFFTGCIGPLPTANDNRNRRFVVVFTNHSDLLVYASFAVLPGNGSVLTWTVPLAPESWDSLILDCRIDQVIPLGALITDPLEGTEPLEVSFDEPPFERGLDFGCGSVFAFQIHPSAEDDPEVPVSADIQVTDSPSANLGVGPGLESGFVLVEASTPRDVSVQINLAWEGAKSRLFQSALTLSGRETSYGFLLPCPVERFALGSLDDDSAAGAKLTESGELIPAPPSLTLDDQACGSTITIELTPQTSGSGDYQLTLQADQTSPERSSTMYEDVRDVLEEQELADRPSSLLLLLPPSLIIENTR